jgi:hypothetical protein
VSQDDMTPEAWRLLQVVREAESPSELDMRRVRRAIAVGAGTALAAPVAKAATALTTSKGAAAVTAGKSAALVAAAKGAAAIVVLASVGAGTAWWSHRHGRDSIAAPSSAAPSQVMTAPPREAAPSTLLEELTLLQQAQRALAGGAPREALSLAGQHAARYPRSQLARERDAVRVFAYCALGEVSRARELTAEILKSAPRSPLRTSLEQSCAAPLPER